ncbi:hypothetical protein [Blastococcus sp. CT_GayMR16]|uniref:hypothetical protein n=1 Tax=Blastococcus sp. CT_GayMR16 TaxID=2559607 RepID=UPI001FD7C531|nr:hypothetical protein [Blastococcus sp. CT_GayMR16]
MRFHSAPVVRLADAKPVQLGHVARADGAQAVVARSVAARARSSVVRSSTPWLRPAWAASACPAATGRPSGCPVAPR